MSYDYSDNFVFLNLAKSNLSNLPTQKSVYFTIQPPVAEFENNDVFLDPWFYRNGVFGNFDSVVGRGASGIVLSGDWFGSKAAFKFVEIGSQRVPDSRQLTDSLKLLNEKLLEMTTIQAIEGSKIVKFYGHYRLVSSVLQQPSSSIGNNFTLTTIHILLLFLESKLENSKNLRGHLLNLKRMKTWILKLKTFSMI